MKKIVLLLAFLIVASPVFADGSELSDKVKPDKNSAKIQTPTDKELQKLLDEKAKYEAKEAAMQAKIEKRQAEINAKKAAKQQKILDDAA